MPSSLAFVGFGAGEREADGQAVQGGQQVQPQPPEVARMAGAVPVLGPSRQVGAAGGLLRPAAFHRGGVHHPHVIAPQRRVRREHLDNPDEKEERLRDRADWRDLRGFGVS